MVTSIISSSQSGESQPKVGATEITNLVLHSGTQRTLQLARSQPSSTPTKENVEVCESNPQESRKLFAKPTIKLMQAVQNQEPGSKPIQVKIVRRDSNEDTSEYESDSSNSTLSEDSPCPKPQTPASGKRPKIDISAMLEEGKLDISQIPEKKALPEVDFPGIPTWFPLKIKLILKDKGFPDALPFKAVHKLTKYRALLEARRRQKWRRYLKAGKCRWQLSNAIKKLRDRPGSTTDAFLEYRISQGMTWKRKATRAMKKLDAIIGAITYLDESMAGIFEAEREVYEKYLD